ncbi:MAG: hypothetical protein AAB839_02980 [Patescibacteria group bacterium]
MTLLWLDAANLFDGHYPHNHDAALLEAALGLVTSGALQAPYADECFRGKIEVIDRGTVLGGSAGSSFRITVRDELDRKDRTGTFLVPATLTRVAAQQRVLVAEAWVN